ncbi:hypothetical protein B0T22DRAFT_444816 [Podospora appendiculata]|uniref:Uncharacterized protein n=1 Tax=Podospora appendiculata TaxID=314037 RepID=A0AAE1C8D1_9PEZI|nr:hypothetical protein B0T22DRAFT_444816 [Podospora appendiculata]
MSSRKHVHFDKFDKFDTPSSPSGTATPKPALGGSRSHASRENQDPLNKPSSSRANGNRKGTISPPANEQPQPQQPTTPSSLPQHTPCIPTAFGGQHVFTHKIGGEHPDLFFAHPTYAGAQYYPDTQGLPLQQSHFSAAPGPFVYSAMATQYPASSVPNTGVNFQPQVPDTSNGPLLHHYVPRHDGGPVFVQQEIPMQVPVQQVPYATCTGAPYQPVPASVPLTPIVVQQPVQQPVMQPMVVQAGVPPPPAPGGPVYMQGPPQVVIGNPPTPGPPMGLPVHPEPAMGIGLTPNEVDVMNNQIAYDNMVDEPQEFKPADDDPSRMYRVRELDGVWTLRNRFTIDNLGDCRWYMGDNGAFYAVRLVR